MMTQTQLENSLARTIKKLLTNEVYFGLFIMQIQCKWDDKVKTLGVAWDGDDFILIISPKYWETRNDFDRYCLLKHELLHLALFHVSEQGTASSRYAGLDHNQVNVAMDMVVNQYINNFDKTTDYDNYCTFETIAKKYKVSPSVFPRDGGWKVQYDIIENLKKQQQQQQNSKQGGSGCCGQGGQGQGQQGGQPGQGGQGQNSGGQGQVSGNHSMWGNGNQSQQTQQQVGQMMENSLKGKMNAAAQQATANGRGTVPAYLKDILDRLNKEEEPVFDWGKFIRQFAQTSMRTHLKLSRNKLNFRYEGYEDLYKGHKKQKEYQILVAVDTSGSVDTQLLKKFFAQIDTITKKADVFVIECDAALGEEFKYKKGMEVKITGRGGTEFQPVIDYYLKNKKRFSSLIYFTDGECDAPEVKFAKSSILWVTYGNYINEKLNEAGKMIHIDPKDY